MPFWGLVITSIGFSVPSLLAFRNKKKKMGKTFGILTCTSILYHGTQHIICKTIDLCYAHIVGVVYTTKGILRYIRYKRWYDFIIICGTAGSIYIFYTGCCNKNLHIDLQNKHHMMFHVLTQYMFSLHAIDDIH